MTASSTSHREPGLAALTASDLDAWAAATAFLSRVLLESPDGPLLSQLGATDMLASWPLPRTPDTTHGLEHLELSGRTGEGLDRIHADHRSLLLGPERVLACPYESVHLDEEHLTFGPRTLRVRRWFAAHGLQAPALGREPDDHIGLELAFISHLCLLALDHADGDADADAGKALPDAVEALAMFVTAHPLQWAGDFADQVVQHAGTHFYRGVGHLLRGLLSEMSDRLGGSQPGAGTAGR